MLMTNQVRAGLVLLGMFFPWLEYRDHGTPGWVLFKNKMFFYHEIYDRFVLIILSIRIYNE